MIMLGIIILYVTVEKYAAIRKKSITNLKQKKNKNTNESGFPESVHVRYHKQVKVLLQSSKREQPHTKQQTGFIFSNYESLTKSIELFLLLMQYPRNRVALKLREGG